MEPYGDCVYCGGEIVERSERIDYRFHGQLYILENVSTGVCQQCGEQFFKAAVAHKMEEAVSTASGPLEAILVPVIVLQ